MYYVHSKDDHAHTVKQYLAVEKLDASFISTKGTEVMSISIG
jgi:hypothetical protein